MTNMLNLHLVIYWYLQSAHWYKCAN